MTDVSGPGWPFDPRTWFPFLQWPTASTSLVQPILPGWSFGDTIVNEKNSSSPETEAQIVAKASYGRQIGRLLDAVYELIERQDKDVDVYAFEQLRELRDEVEKIKKKELRRRTRKLAKDFERLKKEDRDAYEQLAGELRSLFPS